MKPLKDNNTNIPGNKALEAIAQQKLPNYYKVQDHDQFIDIAHKSQKITTAIYMITDLIPEGDPLVQTLRSTSVDIMHRLFSVTSAPAAERVHDLSLVAGLIYGLSSYLQVVFHNGKVSDMNYKLLVSELVKLQERIDVLATKTMPYDRQRRASQLVDEFSFTDTFFETNYRIEKDSDKTAKNLKDTPNEVKDIKNKSTKVQKDNIEKAQISSKKTINKQSTSKGQSSHASLGSTNSGRGNKKDLRHENILKILKQKRDAKIGDLSSLIKDCGSKTIQRDLNELVKKGLVRKEGDRRWSVYNLAY